MNRVFDTLTTGGDEHRRRTSDGSRPLAEQPLTSALPTEDVVLRAAHSTPSLPVMDQSPQSHAYPTPSHDLARGAPVSRDLAQHSLSPVLSAPPTRAIATAASICQCSLRPLSLPQVRAHPSGATVTSVTSSSLSVFTRPPTSLSPGGTDVSSLSSYSSSATTPLSTAASGYASTPLSTGRSPVHSAENGLGHRHWQHAAVCSADMLRLQLTSREREVFQEINARIAALADSASRPRSGLILSGSLRDCDAARPFTPVHIPPGFEEGLANHFDGTFNPRSPHRRRRGTIGAEDTDTDASPGTDSESRPLTPVPIPPNFAHDIQEYFKASMEPRSPESCRRRAAHREKARDRALSESDADSGWPSSPETPPLEDDEESNGNLSDDPIEVIEGVLRAEYEKLLELGSSSGSSRRESSASFGDAASSVAAEYRAGSQTGNRARAAPGVNVARKMAFADRQTRNRSASTADERRAMCSQWLLGLEPAGTALLGRPVVSWR